MVHAIAYVAFILPFTLWIGYELKKSYSFKTYWVWIWAAFITGLAGATLANIYPNNFGNFLLHASGGVSATFLFVYLTRTLDLAFINWRLTLIVLFAFVSMLGVMNELAEYFLELLGFGIFSYDSHDTWRDFVANTTGASLAWGFINIGLRLTEKAGTNLNKRSAKSKHHKTK